MNYLEMHVVGGGVFYGVTIDSIFLQERRKQQLEQRKKDMDQMLAKVELQSPYQADPGFGTPQLHTLQLVERVNAGLIVVGTQESTSLWRLLLGSSNDYLVHNSEGSLF